MNDIWISAMGCFALGIMSTLHPCPLTSTVAAITFLSGIQGSRWQKNLAVAGFAVAYVTVICGIAILISFSVLNIPRMSMILQHNFAPFLGPLFILSGMVLTGLLDFGRIYKGTTLSQKLMTTNYWWAGILLGSMIALAFCPGTAAIYFGAMIPMSLSSGKFILFPILYGFGAVIPVVVISILIHHFQSKSLNRSWLKHLPVVAGLVLIGTGMYITWTEIY